MFAQWSKFFLIKLVFGFAMAVTPNKKRKSVNNQRRKRY